MLGIYRKLAKKAREVDTSCDSCVEDFNANKTLDLSFVKNIFTVIQDKPEGGAWTSAR